MGDVINFTPGEAERVFGIARDEALKASLGKAMLAADEGVVIPSHHGADLYDTYESAALKIMMLKWRGVCVADETNAALVGYRACLGALSQFRPPLPTGEIF